MEIMGLGKSSTLRSKIAGQGLLDREICDRPNDMVALIKDDTTGKRRIGLDFV